MKLLRLKIDDKFRSLQKGFEVHFFNPQMDEEIHEFNPYILVGPNGSGKSNVLEALASIFYHIECIYLKYRPENFRYDEEENPDGFRGEKATPDAFELEYLIAVPNELNHKNEVGYAHIKIVKKDNKKPQIHWVNQKRFSNEETLRSGSLSASEIKELLPKYIIGYSSGENEILSLPFYKMRFIHFDEYKDFLIKDIFYGQAPEGRLIYLDDHLSQAILLSNLLLQPKEILAPFEKELNLRGVKEFRLVIGKHRYEEIHDELLYTLDTKDKRNTKIRKELTSNLLTTIEKLKKCSTINNTLYDEEGLKTFLILDFYVNEETKKAFKFHFNNSALELFQALQILYTLNYYIINQDTKDRLYKSKNIYLKQDMTSISLDEKSIFRIKEFRLDKDGIEDIIYTKSLSDGEHQFIHALGLSLLFKDEPCLFLLDEPETHFNPEWRAKFISCLRECFQKEKNKSTVRDMLITTHTPFLVSDSRKEYVLLFNRDNIDQVVKATRPSFNTLGASTHKITMDLFGRRETIGDHALSEINKLEKRYLNGENVAGIVSDAHILLGDSVEKILFINKILNHGDGK
ncbi:restriction system-associated AAA family ATPase [Lysinibacillus sp. K60]|uniref:restriction system-associated AAA family ATPase n=1 Tax=Lysinibacillus sp. K60 TaxID=2720027 RepID=UPI001C8B81CD|nr:restriction system-associated AAA family ATPase [Lysinibacillus sp. K60]MBX8945339.1 restriction system-associated AAA family ATPase [Lysinibacillus sp. K60]